MGAPNRYTSREAKRLGFASGLEHEASLQLKAADRAHEYESDACKFDYFIKTVRGGVITKEGMTYDLPKGFKVVQWHTYTCDFLITKSDGGLMFIETKGYFKPKDRKKHQALKKQYPDLDLRIIFQSDGKVSHKTRYSQWAEKHGVTYYCLTTKDKKEGRIIPQEWLDV